MFLNKSINKFTLKNKTFIKTLLYLITIILYISTVILWKAPPITFLLAVSLIYFIDRPKYIFDPQNILFGYYVLNFTFPIIFAPRYSFNTFETYEEKLAYILLFSTYFIGSLTFSFLRNSFLKDSFKIPKPNVLLNKKKLKFLWLFLLIANFLLCFLIIIKSSGISFWIENPGRAFLQRDGSGLYNILFIFSCTIFFPLSGYLSLKIKSHKYIFVAIIFFIVGLPFIGGKARSFIYIMALASPYIFFTKLRMKHLVIGFLFFCLCYGSVTYFRSGNYLTSDMIVDYTLNYFTTYENLVVSLSDINPSHFKTCFLPFNKFLTPFGVNNNIVYYDMSAWLTDIYYPTHWAVRATEQWPIETDMYLSFWYIYSLPLLVLFFSFFYIIFLNAIKTKQLGYMIGALNLSFYMQSHLRGGLIIWTDFYFIPMIFFIIYILRKYYL